MIRNGEITARIYLPDAKTGFYRSTRFDWSKKNDILTPAQRLGGAGRPGGPGRGRGR